MVFWGEDHLPAEGWGGKRETQKDAQEAGASIQSCLPDTPNFLAPTPSRGRRLSELQTHPNLHSPV